MLKNLPYYFLFWLTLIPGNFAQSATAAAGNSHLLLNSIVIKGANSSGVGMLAGYSLEGLLNLYAGWANGGTKDFSPSFVVGGFSYRWIKQEGSSPLSVFINAEHSTSITAADITGSSFSVGITGSALYCINQEFEVDPFASLCYVNGYALSGDRFCVPFNETSSAAILVLGAGLHFPGPDNVFSVRPQIALSPNSVAVGLGFGLAFLLK